EGFEAAFVGRELFGIGHVAAQQTARAQQGRADQRGDDDEKQHGKVLCQIHEQPLFQKIKLWDCSISTSPTAGKTRGGNIFEIKNFRRSRDAFQAPENAHPAWVAGWRSATNGRPGTAAGEARPGRLAYRFLDGRRRREIYESLWRATSDS